MAADGSVVIEITGDASDLKREFKKVEASGEQLENAVQGVANNFREAATAARGLDSVSDAFEDGKKSVSEYRSDVMRLARTYQSEGMNMSDAMKRAYAEIDKSQYDMSRNAKKGAKEISDSLDDAAQAARRTGQGMSIAGAGASALAKGFTVLKGALSGVVADLAIRVVDAFVDLGREALNAADSLAKFESTMSFAGFDASAIESSKQAVQDYAARTVYDLETVANTTAQLAANGVKGYVGLTEAAGNLNAVAGGNADTFRSVAMMLTQTAGAGKLTTENWNQLADAIPGASGKLQEAMLQNGAYTGNFRDAMAEGQITAEEFNQAIMQLGMSDFAVEAASSVSTIEGAVGNLKATIVDGISNLLTDGGGMEAITGFINGLSTTFQNAGQYIGPAIDGIRSAISGIGEAFSNAFTGDQQAAILGFLKTLASALVGLPFQLSSTAVQLLAGAFEILITAVGKVVDFFSFLGEKISGVSSWIGGFGEKIAGVLSHIPGPIGEAASSFGGLSSTVSESLSTSEGAVSTWSSSVTGKISAAAGNAAGTASTGFSTFSGNVSNAFSSALDSVNTWGSDVVGQVSTAAGSVADAASTGFGNLAGTVSGALSSASGSINSWGSNVVSTITSAVGNAINAAGSWFSQLPSRISGALSSALSALTSWGAQMGSNAKSAMSKVVSNIGSTLRTAISQVTSIGGQIIQGLINGIKAKASAVVSALKGVIDSAINKAKSLLGIASPSKVFFAFGRFVSLGFANGITAGVKYVVKATKTVAAAAEEQITKLNDKIEAIEAAAQKRQADKELAEYQKNLKEKYTELEKAELSEREKIKEEIAKLEADWAEKQLQAQEKAQKEALQSQIDALEEVRDAYQDAMDEIVKARDSMSGKLSDFELFDNDDGDLYLWDIQKMIDQIQAYGDAMTALKDRGISDSLFQEIVDMDREEAILYAKKLLALGDAQYDAYMNLWKQKEDAAQRVAETVYASEVEAINAEYSEKLPELLGTAAADAMGSFSENLAAAGGAAIDAAAAIADGVIAELERINAAQRLQAAVYSASGSFSGSLSRSANNAAEGQRAARRTAASETAAATAMTSIGNTSREIVLNINGKEAARALVDDIRAVEDQSPRITSD